MRKIGAALILIGAISTPAWAQAAPEATDTQASEAPAEAASVSTTEVEVELSNGIVLRGSILTNDAISWAPGKPLVFTPENGEATTLTAEQVKSVKTKAAAPTDQEKTLQAIAKVLTPEVSDYKSPGGFRYANVGKSRHLYAPSSIGMKQGEGYFSQKWLFSAGAYGVTDNVTLLAGTLTIFPPAVTIAGGKISGEIADNVHLSAGGEVFMTGLDGFDAFAKVGFGGITVGHDDKQLTLSTGYMVLGDEAATPVIVAGQLRTSDRIVLLTENWLVLPYDGDTPFGVGSAAVRLLGGRTDTRRSRPNKWTTAGDPKYTWDFGILILAIDEGAYGPLPWIDFAWHFGKPGR